MLFERFLKKRAADTSKPKSPPPPAAKPRNQDALIEQALRHPDAAKRADAMRQLLDPVSVAQCLGQEHDPLALAVAANRYAELIAQPCPPGTATQALLDGVARIQDESLLERIARQGHLAETRRAALERVGSPRVLADCAVQDALAGNRALAIERLDDKDALEEVARRIGKKDKKVYRIAREKLRLIAEREEFPRRVREQCEELHAKLERLGRLGHWNQDRALLEHLDRQWSLIQPHADTQWQARIQSERQRFLDAHETYRRENASQIAEQEAQEAARAQAESLLDALSALTAQDDETHLHAECERIATDWKALPPLAPDQRAPLDQRYRMLMGSLTKTRQAVASQRDLGARLDKTLVKLERILGDSKPLDQKQAKRLLDQGHALAADAQDTDQARAFQVLAERLETRLHTQRKHAEQRLKQFPERLDELEQHLDEGELKKADPLYQSLLAALELIQSSGIHSSTESEFAHRLRALSPRLRELQHWRRWGADQHREGLCDEMEGLIERDLPLAAMAEQLHALQMDWKRLDKSGSPANQTLWERFHQASEVVYARCRPFMESQAAEREANRIARERVCQQLEEFLSQVDWERVDWKKTLRAERDMRQLWAAIGPTDGRARKSLERRFHQSLRQLDQRLDAERKRNQAHKLHLIERVEALIDLPDLESAIEQTKSLQREWHTTVPARQKDENRLWQQFRAACDAVFARRAALQQAHANELAEHLATREAICAEAESVAAAERDPKRLTIAQRELMQRWRAAESLPVPRQSASALTQRWKQCQEALERQRQAAERRQRLEALSLLQRQSEICERLELTLLDAVNEGMDAEAARRAWAELPRQADGELQRAIEQRLERALDAAEDPAKRASLEQVLAANGEQREQMCLRLEIIAGVETPPEFAQQRLALQVERLTERMVEGEEDPLQGASRLLYDWYLIGPAARNGALSARFERVRDAMAAA